MFEQNSGHENNRSPNDRSRSRSPVRSRSPTQREWKRVRRDSSGGGGERTRTQRRDDNVKVRLYVSNIPYEVRWQDLKDIFKQQLGPDGITYVEMYDGPDGKPCGAGVVEVRGRHLAEKAVETMHRFEYKGRQIVVREEREKDRIRHMKQDTGGGDMGGPGLMGNMNQRMMGNVGSGNMGGSSGSNITVGNLNLNLSLLNQLGIDPGSITDQVFVANLDYKVTPRKLKDIFRMAGVIVSAEIKMDKEGKSRGMGVIKFDHPLEAVQAISMFNGQMLYERCMSVRMDKMPDTSSYLPQSIPSKFPQGLKGCGMGLGVNGAPLQDIGRIANCLSISTLTNIVSGTGGNTGMGVNNSMGMGIGMGGGMGNNSMDMGGGMGGNMMGGGGMGGMGGNMGGGMGSMGGMGNSNMGGMAGGMGSNMGSNNMGGMGTGMGGVGMGGNLGGGMGGMAMSGNAGMGGLGMASNMGMMNQLGGMNDNRNMGMNQLGGMNDSFGGMMGRGGGRGRSTDTNSIIVRNLPFSYTWQNLKEKFQDCGEVRFTEIKMENGKSKGWGTVRFTSSEDARRAVNLMNGARIEGRMIDVSLDK